MHFSNVIATIKYTKEIVKTRFVRYLLKIVLFSINIIFNKL